MDARSLNGQRACWVALNDAQLLAQCDVYTYRASGPGGQKRNKTSSAVRIRHRLSGLIVIAEESRSQHENKARALKRLRRAFCLNLREIVADDLADVARCREPTGRLVVHPRSADYLAAVAQILDILEDCTAGVRDAAQRLETSTANLIDFLSADANVWRAVNELRTRHGRPPLRD